MDRKQGFRNLQRAAFDTMRRLTFEAEREGVEYVEDALKARHSAAGEAGGAVRTSQADERKAYALRLRDSLPAHLRRASASDQAVAVYRRWPTDLPEMPCPSHRTLRRYFS